MSEPARIRPAARPPVPVEELSAPSTSKIAPTRRAVVPVSGEALEEVEQRIPVRRTKRSERPRPRLIVFPSTVVLEDAFPPIPAGALLTEARDHLLATLDEGVSCPCCGQFAKRYWRGLNATMARGLLWLVKASGRDLRWVHVNSEGPAWLTSKGGTTATMAHWGLIEEKPKDEKKESRTSALWRPTVRGVRFARNQILIPSHVVLYNNRVEGCSESTISIVEALGRKFDYAELMAGMTEEDALHESGERGAGSGEPSPLPSIPVSPPTLPLFPYPGNTGFPETAVPLLPCTACGTTDGLKRYDGRCAPCADRHERGAGP